MKRSPFIFILLFLSSCNYGLPLIRFKSQARNHFVNNGAVTQDHKAYNYIHITRYGVIGFADKMIYRSSDTSKIDSVFITKGTMVFDGCTTTRQKKIVYDAFGNNKVVVKTRTRTHGWFPATHKIITKMYVPIRRMRTVERY